MNNHRLTAYVLLLITSIIWGVAGPVIKYTLTDFPPFIFLTYRFAVSALAALVIFAFTRPKLPKTIGELVSIGIYGVLTSTVALGLLFLGFEKTTALTGTLLSAVSPLMIAAAGALFLHDKVTRIERIGITIACAGTLITVFEPMFLGGNGAQRDSVVGNLLILGSLLVGVENSVHSKLLLRDHITPSLLTHLSFIVGFFSMIPIVLYFHTAPEIVGVFVNAPLSAHAGVWYMGLLSGTLAYTLWHIGQKSIEISEVAIFSYLLPIFGAPLSVLWLSEAITPPFLLGAFVITLGVIIAEYKQRQKKLLHRPALRTRRSR